jgi:uncharacterized membrane protein YdjX (TVP38/TMEM64 family)
MKINKKKVLGLIVIIFIIYINFEFKQRNILTYENLDYYRDYMVNFVNKHWFLSIISYVLVYILVIVLALPGVAVMTFTGGLLFPFFHALGLIMFAGTIGAIINFITARYFLRDFFKRIFSKTIEKVNNRIEVGGFRSLFILRTIPIFPYSVVNFSLGVSDLSLKKFILVTALGKIPGSSIIIFTGSSLSEVDSIRDFTSPQMILAIILLLGFIILPMVYKVRKK